MRTTQIDSEINVLDRTFAYRTDPYTSQVAQLKYPSLKGGYAFHYTYDNAGNISGYELICANSGYNEAKFTYQYDSQNQLISATDGTVTFTYSYDDAGNILTANGHTYTYGNADWGDLLTAYDGSAITYDGVGNPLSYNGWNFTWKKGRQLAAATNGSTTVSYTYDADGLRTSKTVNGVVYTYYYVGSQLARMTYGDYVLDFFYDANGTPIAMRQGYASSSNYTVYYYITNLQGDVIRLVDVNGSTAAYYEYDPYGNAIQAAGSHCNINPLRYRGYIYDSETSLYYLQSRYYNPEWGRFLNADSFTTTGQGFTGNNMFAYCGNNPVNRTDSTGQFWEDLWEAFTQALQQASSYFAVAAGVTQVDSPAPGLADVAGVAMAFGGLLVCAVIAVETIILAEPTTNIFAEEEEKAEAAIIAKKPNSPVIFPVDPNDFTPWGLVKVPRSGTKNGSFISWMDPFTQTEVFRWDENPNYPNGPHYHIYGTGHYYPGTIVPEPYATVYFPFRKTR